MNEAESRRKFFNELVDQGHFLPTGVPGVHGRGAEFEDAGMRLMRVLDGPSAADGAERVHFPPLMSRAVFQRSGYMDTMPHLGGCVHSFAGDDAAHQELIERIAKGEPWDSFMQMTDVTLTPAACYPVYPMCAQQGRLPEDGRRVDLLSWIFRHEPSDDPARLQCFRQREMVRLGTPAQVQDWRQVWMDRGMELLTSLQLEVSLQTANDPFFGRGGRMLKANQRALALKFEIQTPICSDEPTAVTSFNYHESHFGDMFSIATSDGAVAHTACLGFGFERITLALFKTHGLRVVDWPLEVRKVLGYDG
jgi:seryl-tRNA synthetase